MRDAANADRLYAVYMEARHVLNVAILEAKKVAREEMLGGLDENPWGRPYRAARNKLRPIGPPVVETLKPALLSEVVQGLFPDRSAEFVPPRKEVGTGA